MLLQPQILFYDTDDIYMDDIGKKVFTLRYALAIDCSITVTIQTWDKFLILPSKHISPNDLALSLWMQNFFGYQF